MRKLGKLTLPIIAALIVIGITIAFCSLKGNASGIFCHTSGLLASLTSKSSAGSHSSPPSNHADTGKEQNKAKEEHTAPEVKDEPEKTVSEPVKPAPEHLVVYYFHGKSKHINYGVVEGYINKTLTETYQGYLKNGRLILRSVDVCRPENEHYAYEYNVYTPKVIVVKVSKGKEIGYKELDMIFDFMVSEKKLNSYMKKEIGHLL